MPIRSLGNPAVRYNAVMSKTGKGAEEPYPPMVWYGSRGIWGGGSLPSITDVIQYKDLSTTSNTTDFGDLTSARGGVCATSGGVPGGVRGVFFGGDQPSASNVIDYITVASTGNATDFGDLPGSYGYSGACSNGIRGIVAGDGSTPTYQNKIRYITIATTSNTTSFGNLTYNATSGVAGAANSTRGTIAAGGTTNNIDYFTIMSAGNASDFGDLTYTTYGQGGCSSSEGRGVYGGGSSPSSPYRSNIINYITIDTAGNATDFGDLTTARYYVAACSSGTRGSFGGGQWHSSQGSPTIQNVIDYITFDTTGNASDMGDLLARNYTLASCAG